MKMSKLYPINYWAYITEKQVNYLLDLIGTSIFNSKADINTQVYNYLNYRWQYISDNDWLLYNENRTQIAFNIGLKPCNIEKGDDYIFAIFSKNEQLNKQEWKLLCFCIRGTNSLKYKETNILDLYKDQSKPIPKITIPSQFSLSFGFNHLFNIKKDNTGKILENRLDRIPKIILERFNIIDDITKRILSSMIKFAILNDNDNISQYHKKENNEKQITTSFDPDKFLLSLNLDNDETIPQNEKVLNEPPYSYLYPVCIQNPNYPDFAIVFRKKGRGEHTQYIMKTILKLSDAQMNARVFKPNLEDTWLSNKNVNRYLDNNQ
jgi:hypothetical protein